MKSLKKEHKNKVRITPFLSVILLFINVVCGLFMAVGYYYIGFMIGLLALFILSNDLIRYLICFIKKQQTKQIYEEARWEREEKEFEELLYKAKREAKVSVEIQLKEQYREQLKKVIYIVLLKNNIMDNSIANNIEKILLNNKRKDFISDEELYFMVEKTLVEMNKI